VEASESPRFHPIDDLASSEEPAAKSLAMRLVRREEEAAVDVVRVLESAAG
jgi:hypothetical protein